MEDATVQRTSADFPALLNEISDPPQHIFTRGNYPPPPDFKYLCIVGSRKYTPYGKSVCQKLVRGLRGYPIVIVSGLALGIDAFAHEAALEAGLMTIAVPGSGLKDSVIYPRSNLSLAHRILKAGGLLLSEFPPDFKARPESFPQRNRIMAGLSHAILVIEAEERSGTLVTARLAAEYNRDVFAVPGPLTSTTSAGPHYLIQQGAKLISSSADILEALALDSTEPTVRAGGDISENEKRVLELLRAPLTREEIVQNLSLPINDVNVLLSVMEIKGLIIEELGSVRKK